MFKANYKEIRITFTEAVLVSFFSRGLWIWTRFCFLGYFQKIILYKCSGILDDIRGGSRTAATSKMERFVIIGNSWKPLTIITKGSILDVAAALDPPLDILCCFFVVKQFVYSIYTQQKVYFYLSNQVLVLYNLFLEISIQIKKCFVRFHDYLF